MDNVVEISHSLKILGRMERGEGLLGELTTDPATGRRLRLAPRRRRHPAAGGPKVETGEGPLARLINDRAMGDKLALSLDRLEGCSTRRRTARAWCPACSTTPREDAVEDTLAKLTRWRGTSRASRPISARATPCSRAWSRTRSTAARSPSRCGRSCRASTTSRKLDKGEARRRS